MNEDDAEQIKQYIKKITPNQKVDVFSKQTGDAIQPYLNYLKVVEKLAPVRATYTMLLASSLSALIVDKTKDIDEAMHVLNMIKAYMMKLDEVVSKGELK